jgi:hypothetical protein
MRFPLGPNKSESNQRDHRVPFEESSTVFDDPLASTIPDPDHSICEERLLTMGQSSEGKLLVVSHTGERGNIHIVTARRATPHERKDYET